MYKGMGRWEGRVGSWRRAILSIGHSLQDFQTVIAISLALHANLLKLHGDSTDPVVHSHGLIGLAKGHL